MERGRQCSCTILSKITPRAFADSVHSMLLRLTGSDSAPLAFRPKRRDTRTRRRPDPFMKISFHAGIVAICRISFDDEAPIRLAPSRGNLTRKPSWCIFQRLVIGSRSSQKESPSGVLERSIESNTAVSPLVLRQPAHVARPGPRGRPARVRVERKAAPIALRRGAECRAGRVRA